MWATIAALGWVVSVVLLCAWLRAAARLHSAESHARWLAHQADELRADYVQSIAQAKRMAMRAVEMDS